MYRKDEQCANIYCISCISSNEALTNAHNAEGLAKRIRKKLTSSTNLILVGFFYQGYRSVNI